MNCFTFDWIFVTRSNSERGYTVSSFTNSSSFSTAEGSGHRRHVTSVCAYIKHLWEPVKCFVYITVTSQTPHPIFWVWKFCWHRENTQISLQPAQPCQLLLTYEITESAQHLGNHLANKDTPALKSLRDVFLISLYSLQVKPLTGLTDTAIH